MYFAVSFVQQSIRLMKRLSKTQCLKTEHGAVCFSLAVLPMAAVCVEPASVKLVTVFAVR